MAKGKKKRKRRIPTKEERMEQAHSWVEAYEGDNIVKGYSKWSKLNLKNSMKELELVGIKVSQQDRDQVKKILQERKIQKERKKERRKQKAMEDSEYGDSDDTFAFIAGYTEGGAPYGITHEEMKEIESNEKGYFGHLVMDEESLPF